MPVALRVAVFGAALAAALTRVVARFGAGVLAMVVPAVRRVRWVGEAVFGAAVFGALALGAAALGAAGLPAGDLESAAFGAAAFGAAFAGASATASTTMPGVSDDERTFDQVRSPRSARLP